MEIRKKGKADVETQILERGGDKIIVVGADQEQIETDADFYQLLTLCAEQKVDKLVLFARSLPKGFFDPRMGRAEEILRRFSRANIKIALVTSIEELRNGFYETALGMTLRFQFRVFYTQDQAEEWLTND